MSWRGRRDWWVWPLAVLLLGVGLLVTGGKEPAGKTAEECTRYATAHVDLSTSGAARWAEVYEDCLGR